MPLRFTLRSRSAVPLEVEGITPDSVRGKSLAQIEQLDIFQGNVKLPLAEFFAVSGDPADELHDWEGDLAGVHWIGTKMAAGRIVVHGNAGRHVGSEMTGGEIHVHGDASDWVGGEMHGGLIHVRGKAGHLIGSAYRGSRFGMTGGTILVGGAVGNEVGHTLRRGLIAVGGGCGDFVGFNMIAGTVLTFGDCGIRPAAGMRRGTVGLFGAKPPSLLGTFTRGCVWQPQMLRLMLRMLQSRGFAVPEACWNAQYRVYHGDNVTVGRGEVLVREA